MNGVVSIHSSRGGTGKSLMAVNLAATYAKQGMNVSLIDLDFRAPSLNTVFDISNMEYSVNDFLNGQCQIEDVLIDLREKYDTNGRFLIGVADPSVEGIRDMMSKSRKWEIGALKKLLNLKSDLENLKVDCVIHDTSPGILYSSVNAVTSSDVSLIVLTLDELDIAGTKRMIKDIYDAFQKRTFILINKAFPERTPFSDEANKGIIQQIEKTLNKPVIGEIPCFCDVLAASRNMIFTLNKPEHAFTKSLEALAKELAKSLEYSGL
jgi:MinD-like ATPase involved in chromosome partitioning or flagellar assembly